MKGITKYSEEPMGMSPGSQGLPGTLPKSVMGSGLEGLKSHQVIVIEDEVLMQALLDKHLRALMKKSPFSFCTLPSGWDLLTADLSHIKVAVVDLLLPQVTGVDLIRDFRVRYPHLGIVPISGMATEPMKRALKDCLPDGFNIVPKPLRKELFAEAFLRAWNFNEQRPRTPQASPALEAGEDLWSVGNTDLKNIAVERRKLLRRKPSAS